MSGKTATKQLREMLDERGVPYETNDDMGASETRWNGFTAYQLTPNAKLVMHPTPEQAIAATLGNSRAERTTDDEWEIYHHSVPATDENIAKFGWVRERTCEFNIKNNMNETEGMGDVWIECSACNCVFDFYADEWLMKMNYCPNCGARRVDE